MPDTGFSGSRDTKVFNLIELYWLNKAFIAQVVEERGHQQQGIQWKLDLLEKKFKVVCKEVYDINIIVSDNVDPKTLLEQQLAHLMLLKALLAIPFNLMMIQKTNWICETLYSGSTRLVAYVL
jgi:hypothetical protein